MLCAGYVSIGSTTTGRRLPRTTFSAVDPNSSFSAVPRATHFANYDRIDRKVLGFSEDLQRREYPRKQSCRSRLDPEIAPSMPQALLRLQTHSLGHSAADRNCAWLRSSPGTNRSHAAESQLAFSRRARFNACEGVTDATEKSVVAQQRAKLYGVVVAISRTSIKRKRFGPLFCDNFTAFGATLRPQPRSHCKSS